MSIEIIKGSAGTGKTHKIIQLVKENPSKYIICAPTHKALKVLTTRLQKNGITGYYSGTVQSTFYQYIPTEKTKKVLDPIFDPETKKQLIDTNGELKFNIKEEPLFTQTFSLSRLITKFNLDGLNPIQCEKSEFFEINPNYLPIAERVSQFNFSNYTIIIDEASMLQSEMWYELLKTDLHIIFVGDEKQLPPIESKIQVMTEFLNKYNTKIKKIQQSQLSSIEQKSELLLLQNTFNEYSKYLPKIKQYVGFFKKVDATIKLTKIYRQCSGSDILSIANTVYTTGRVPYPFNAHNSDVICEEVYNEKDFLNRIDILLEADIVLAYTKKVCGYINAHIRSIKFKDQFSKIPKHKHCLPVIGDKIYINEEYNILNYNDLDFNKNPKVIKTLTKGSSVTIKSINSIDSLNNIMYIDCVDELNELYEQVPINLNFTLPQSLKNKKISPNSINVLFGYALTVHKAQGSQYNTVCVADENHYYTSKEWLYTAVTRASDALYCLKWKGLKNV